MFSQVCDENFQKRYLIKYTVGTDEKQKVKFFLTENPKVLEAAPQDFQHTKLPGQNVLNQNKKKGKIEPCVREVGLCELLFYMHGFPYTYCTVDFVHVSTYEAAERTVVCNMSRGRRGRGGDRNRDIAALTCRPDPGQHPKRQFTHDQEVLIRDDDVSAVAHDKVAAFGMRPPELISFDELGRYYQALSIKGKHRFKENEKLNDDPRLAPFIDGLGRRVMLRWTHVRFVQKWMCERQLAIQQNLERIPRTTSYSPKVKYSH